MSGSKYDQGKPMLDLVRPEFIEGVAEVLTFGAKKYAAHNWTQGIEYSRIIAALKRHLAEIEKGYDYDDESGLPHIDHVGCCVMFLSCFMKWDRDELDNRFKTEQGIREGFNVKIKEALDELRSDVPCGFHDDSSEGLPTTECSARQKTVSDTDELSDGFVRVHYDRSGSDNPELVASNTSGAGRSDRLLNVDVSSQEIKEKLEWK